MGTGPSARAVTFKPRITHQVDSLELVQDLMAAGLGVRLLPVGQPTVPEVRLLELRDPAVTLRSYALTDKAGHAGLRWNSSSAALPAPSD